MQAQVGPMQTTSNSLQAFLSAVQCGTPRPPEIETVIHVVANAEVTLVGAVGWRQPDKAIPGHEQVRIGNHDVNAPRGDGEFRQVIDATRLSEGIHFITVRAYRHQPAGSPAVFSDFKKVIYIDRLPPVSEFDSFRPVEGNATETEVLIRSTDQTADSVHVFANLPASMTEAQILAEVNAGKGRLERFDRALFRGRLQGLPRGTNTLTIVTFEFTGTRSIKRVTATMP